MDKKVCMVYAIMLRRVYTLNDVQVVCFHVLSWWKTIFLHGDYSHIHVHVD